MKVSSSTFTIEDTVQFSYDFVSLSQIIDKVSTETFTYDNIGRLINDNCIYNHTTGSFITNEIDFIDDISNPTADKRVKTYTYKVDGYRKAYTSNTYDTYKRIQQKKYRVEKINYTKNIEYDKTKPSRVIDKKTY